MKTAHLNDSEYLNFCKELSIMAPAHTELGKIQRKEGIRSYNALRLSQWSPQFETFMRNRLIMGGLRYGVFGDPKKATYDNVGSVIRRMRLYKKTGNQEHLVDAANICLCEFVDQSGHPDPHWSPTDDGVHVEVIR